MYEESDDGEPYASVIRATWFDKDDCVLAIDDLTDWVLWVTDPNNPADWAVRDAARRLRNGKPGGADFPAGRP